MKFITIGSDPEFFVLDNKGQPYPATPFAIGTKDKPEPIKELGDGYFEQRDNISFEGNIPAAKTKEEFIANVTKLRNYFLSKISKYDYSISPNGVEYFAKRYLQSAEAMEFGCSKVISCWDSVLGYGQHRPTPVLDKLKFRVSGFHIHIGYDAPIKEFGYGSKISTDILIGRLFDLFVTIPSHRIKPEPERITTYGRWGMIRSKNYGVECRTLSTFFTQEKHLGWVWDQVFQIEKFINSIPPYVLKIIIKNRHIVGDDAASILKIFADFKKKIGYEIQKSDNTNNLFDSVPYDNAKTA